MSLAAPAIPAPGTRYRHTQLGWFMLGLDVVLLLLVGIPAARSGQPALWVGAALIAVIAILFSTLTVEVTGEAVRFWFGPGVLRRTVPFPALAGAEISSAPWWYGIGIRFTPTGLMYNVATGRTVDLVLRSGKRMRVGTDEPEALLEAVRTAMTPLTPAAGTR